MQSRPKSDTITKTSVKEEQMTAETNTSQKSNITPNKQNVWDYNGFATRMSARLEKVRRLLQGEETSSSLQKDKELSRA